MKKRTEKTGIWTKERKILRDEEENEKRLEDEESKVKK